MNDIGRNVQSMLDHDSGHEDRRRFIFEAMGTRGDVAPFLGIGEELARLGHAVELLAHESFGPEASSRGLHFTAVHGTASNFDPEERRDPASYVFPAFERVAAFFSAAPPGRTLLVNADRRGASNLFAERFGLPTVRLHLSPYKLRSLVAPPWPFRARTAGRFGELYRKYALPKFYHACDTEPRVLARINHCRQAAGLDAVATASYDEAYLCGELCLFPAWYCPPVEDWPRGIELSGFPLSTSRASLPEEVGAFIERFGAPLVFTPGTGVRDVGEFFEAARVCCEVSGLPGVFLSPRLARPTDVSLGTHTDGGAVPTASPLFCTGYVDLAALLPRAALLVHHGGIGTTAEAMRAGVPQIVSPLGFDQPDNAERVARLGVGTRIDRDVASGEALALAAAELLASARVRQRLSDVKRALAEPDAVQRCARALITQLDGAAPGATPRAPRGVSARAGLSYGGELSS